MSPAPPGRSLHRNGKQLAVRAVDRGVTQVSETIGLVAAGTRSTVDASVTASGLPAEGYKVDPERVPLNRKARRLAAARARRAR